MKRTILAASCCILLSSCDSYFYKDNKSFLWGLFAIVVALFVIRRLTKPNPATQLDTIHSHQSHHFEDFQMSSSDFYQTLAEIIKERGFPKVKTTVVPLDSGGLLDAKRNYLKVYNDNFIFYVCAAPFGKNFFVSYWLRETEEEFADYFLRKVFGVVPKRTFFETDAEAMFVASIKKAVMQAITHTTEQRGLRKLTPEELTPTILS